MKVNWKSVAKLAVAVIGQAVPAVRTVEDIIEALPHAQTSQQKQDLAFALVKASVESAEGLTGKDLLNDIEVQTATRGVIDATVALKNILAKKSAPTPVLAGSTGE